MVMNISAKASTEFETKFQITNRCKFPSNILIAA